MNMNISILLYNIYFFINPSSFLKDQDAFIKSSSLSFWIKLLVSMIVLHNSLQYTGFESHILLSLFKFESNFDKEPTSCKYIFSYIKWKY